MLGGMVWLLAIVVVLVVVAVGLAVKLTLLGVRLVGLLLVLLAAVFVWASRALIVLAAGTVAALRAPVRDTRHPC